MTAAAESPEPEWVSPEAYLERERNAASRSEYRDGRIMAMTAGPEEHSLLSVNLTALLHSQLRGGSCRVYNSDLKVRLPNTLRYVYPDATVVCGPSEFQDERKDILTNPTVILEVLSDSTEAYDRGEKWERYQRLPSLREYVLVSQSHATVERYCRQGDLWIYALTSGLEASVMLESIGVTLPLADIYEGITPASLPADENSLPQGD